MSKSQNDKKVEEKKTYGKNINKNYIHLQGMTNVNYMENKQMSPRVEMKLKCAFLKLF